MIPFKFADPLWLLGAALAAGVLLWAWRRGDARQRAALGSFAAARLHGQLTASISLAKRFWKRALFLGAVAALFAALARPQAGVRWEEAKRRGIEVLFAVDTSRSMLTPDVKPNRLARAKLAVDDFVGRMDGDGVGLIAFAGTAFLQCPITLDYGAFDESLAALDTGVIPIGGTNIASAIREAQAALQDRPATDRILILLTDGEDLSGDALAAAKAAAKDGLKICTVGVGTANGDLIPLPDDLGGGFVKDEAGQFVKSHLDETRLRAIAEVTGGVYAPLGSQGQGLDLIYGQALAPLARRELASRRQQIYIERFQWPLGAALLFLLSGPLIGSRRRVRSPGMGTDRQKETVPPLGVSAPVLLLLLLLLVPVERAHASPATAAKAYQQGDFVAAQQQYLAAAQRAPQQPLLEFNAGAAAYRAGNYGEAASALAKSVELQPSVDPQRIEAQEDAYYDLGNTLYRAGQKTATANSQQAIQTWGEAVKNYDSALQLRPGDADAKYNRDFVQQKLEALKKQEQQKQDQAKLDQAKLDQAKQDQAKQPGSKPDTDQTKAGQSGSKPGQNNEPAKSGGQPGAKPEQKEGSPSKSPGAQSGDQKSSSAAKSPSQGQSGKENGAKSEESKAAAQTGAQPNSSGAQPQPPAQAQANAGSGEKAGEQPDDAQREPGQMSRADARALLDSVKDEERRLPGAPVARSGEVSVPTDQTLRDW